MKQSELGPKAYHNLTRACSPAFVKHIPELDEAPSMTALAAKVLANDAKRQRAILEENMARCHAANRKRAMSDER